MLTARSTVVLLASLVLVSSAAAQGRGPRRPKIDAEKSVLEAKLIANEDTYTIPAGQEGKDFAETLQAPNARDLPEPPKVDLVLELKNPTDKPVTIVVGSDAGALDLKLEGPGAVSVEAQKIFTREFRGGKEVTIEPGKTREIPITSLKYGFRGVAQHAYWTEPGEYKLSAVLRWPHPDRAEGRRRKVLEAAAGPVTLHVKSAK